MFMRGEIMWPMLNVITELEKILHDAHVGKEQVAERARILAAIQPLPDMPPLKDDEPEIGHTFTKISHQPFATCNDCKTQVQFADNPNAHREMMTHECSENEPTENQKFYRRI